MPGFDREKIVTKKKRKPSKLTFKFIKWLDHKKGGTWNILLNPKQKKGAADLRKEKKSEVHYAGFTQKREMEIRIATQCWVTVRVFGYTVADLLAMFGAKNLPTKNERDIRMDILKPIDDALGMPEKKPGRTLGKKSLLTIKKP